MNERKYKTACKHGHPYTEGSFYLDRYGDPICRKCASVRSLKSYYKRKLKIAA